MKKFGAFMGAVLTLGLLIPVLVVVELALGAPAAGAGQPAGADLVTSTNLTVTTFADLVVDPTTGKIFVSGNDKVDVLDAAGTYLMSIPNLFGAAGLAVEGGSLWVTETTAGEIAQVDIASGTVTKRFTIGRAVSTSIAVIGGTVWFTGDPSGTDVTLMSLNPTTEAVVSHGFRVYGGRLEEIPGTTSHLLIHDRGLSPYSVYKVNIAVRPVVVEGDVDHGVGSNLREVAATEQGTFVTASGWPYEFREFNLATMNQSGIVYPGANYPSGIAYTPGAGGVFVGSTQSTGNLYVSRRGVPLSTHVITGLGDIAYQSVAVANDASRAYAVISGSPLRLAAVTLAPTTTGITPSSVVAGIPNEVKITGTGLGGVTGASIEGYAATFTVVSSTELRVQVPTEVQPGSRSIRLSTPFGDATSALTVQSNTGAILTGLVRRGPTAAAGIQLTLSGGSLTSARSATSAANGSYTFTGVPYGTTYQLLAHDPSGVSPDQTVKALTLTPNQTSTINVDLQAVAAPSGPELSRVPLPIAQTARGVVVDPGTSRVFVAVGDEVDAFDRDGRLLTRFQQQFGAMGMDVAGGYLFVNQRTGGAISKIDVSTLEVVATYPTGMLTNGALAVAGGKVWFTKGNDQWVSLAAMDPATGLVTSTTCPNSCYVPGLGGVTGDDGTLLAWNGLSPSSIQVYDATTLPPTLKAVNPHGSLYNPSDVEASGPLQRVWPANGVEFDLTTMVATGVQYPRTGGAAVGYSPAKGGVLVFGRTVVRPGAPLATHELTADPVTAGVVVDPAGDRVVMATTTNELVVYDLKARIGAITPSTVVAGAPASMTVTGFGLGSVTGASIQGFPATLHRVSASEVRVDLPGGVEPGARTLILHTPFGNVTTGITVQVNVGATLSGVVRREGVPAGGVQLTLTGAGLDSPRSTTTSPSGAYAITGVPHGTSYELLVHDPSGLVPDRRERAIALVPNATKTLDIDLQLQPPRSVTELARVALPVAGPAREVVVDPATSRLFVSVGNEVDVFDRDGRLLRRFEDLFGADGLAVDNGFVFVNQTAAGAITKLTTDTLEVVGTFPTGRWTDGAVAVAGGKVWFTNGNDQWVSLAAMDPNTGAVTPSSCPNSCYVPRLGGVLGDATLLLAWNGLSPSTISVYDATTVPPTFKVANSHGSLYSPTDVEASALVNKVWPVNGVEFNLSTMQPTGVTYPRSGGAAVGYSPAQGGVLAFGQTVARAGVPVATHELPANPVTRGLTVDPAGDRVALASTTNDLVVYDLKPQILSVTNAAPGVPGTATISGFGLGGATQVRLRGAPIPYTATASTITLNHQGLTDGVYPIEVVTPWGTASIDLLSSSAPAPVATDDAMIAAHDTAKVVSDPALGLLQNDTGSLVTITAHSDPAHGALTLAPNGTMTYTPDAGYSGVDVFQYAITDDYGRKDLATVTITVSEPVVGSGYVPLVPVRALDSRFGTGGWTGPLSAGPSRALAVNASVGVPSDAVAVVMNVTVTSGSDPSYLTVHPTGSPPPNASNLNFGAGETVANLVTVNIGMADQVSFRNAIGSVDVVADVVGYYGPVGPTGDSFTGITPARLLDSRGSTGGWSGRIGEGDANTRTLDVTDVGGVPADATSVVLNVTATESTNGSFVVAYPDGVARPKASNVNFGAGQTIPNLVIVKVGTGGLVRFFNAVGSTHLVVDVVGYYRPGAGSRFHGVEPTRLLDDRVGTGWVGPLGEAQTRSLDVAGTSVVPVNATSVVMNTTVTGGTAGSFLTLFPHGVARPSSSNLNFGPGQTTANLVMVRIGADGRVDFYNQLGSVDVIADVVGYFA